jgi:hypothetical protein
VPLVSVVGLDMIVFDLRHRRRTRLDGDSKGMQLRRYDRPATTARSAAKANPAFTRGATGRWCDVIDNRRVLAHSVQVRTPSVAVSAVSYTSVGRTWLPRPGSD